MKCHFRLSVFIICLYLLLGYVCDQDIKGIVPEEYLLSIEPFFNNGTFRGKVSITIFITSATTQIILRAEQIKQEGIKFKSLDSSKSSEINVGFSEANGSWLFSTPEDLVGRYSLNISYTGYLNNITEEEGLLYNLYIDDETEKVYAVYKSSSHAGTSYRLFPAFDRPFLKTPFTAYIIRDPQYLTLSSMQLQETDTKGDKLCDKYYSPNISINQVGLIIHQLSNVTTVDFTLLAKSEALDQKNLTLSLLPIIVELLQEKFKDQIIEKLDIVALPEGGSEMGFYPGLVICSEDQILFKEKVSNSKCQEKIEGSVVHILVKQMLTHLETEDAEFFEGLATYMEHKLLSQMDPSRKMREAPYYMAILDEETSNSTDIFHKKVAAILKMNVDNMSTEETVMNALSYLLNERKPCTSEDFLLIVDQLLKKSNLPSNHSVITDIQAWLAQPGWPIVTVTMNETEIEITQKSSSGGNATWPIPISFKCDQDYMNDENNSHHILLTDYSHKVMLESPCQWVLFHMDNSLYRVNYGTFGWQNLTDQLIMNHSVIPVEARSRLVDDIFHLAERGLVRYSQVFYLTRYLVNERDYLPWHIAAFNFEKLIKLFYGKPLAVNLKDYVKAIYKPYFEEVYSTKALNEPRIKRLASFDALFWGCHWELELCLHFTSELFKQWRSVSTGFPPDFKQAALCTGVRASPEVFMEVFDAFTQSVVEGDRLVFLKALACTNNTSHIHFLLELVFLDESQMMIGHHSKLPLIEDLVEYPANLDIVVNFLVKNYNSAVTSVGLKMMSSVWTAIERGIFNYQEIVLIQNMVINSSLPVSLRERLGSVLVNAGNTQNKSIELAPLVSEGLSQHWTSGPGVASSARQCSCFYASTFLKITLLLLMCFASQILGFREKCYKE